MLNLHMILVNFLGISYSDHYICQCPAPAWWATEISMAVTKLKHA